MKKIPYLFIFVLFFSLNINAKDIEILLDIPGQGLEIKKHFKVHVNYRGTLENGKEFDSSFSRNQPFIFQIGLRQVILGWEKGLLGMRVGGKRTIRIPPELGYGSRGAGELIPPNATLIFEVEIIDAFAPGYYELTSSDLINKQKEERLILIDIRTDEERKYTGVIKGSIEITAFDISGKFNPSFITSFQVVAKKDDHVAFISNEGEISAILANGFVEQIGYANMYTLVGGIQNWIKEGKDLVN